MNYEIKDFIGVYNDVFSKEYCLNAIDYFDSMAKAGFSRTRQEHEGPMVTKSLKEDSMVFSVDYVQHFNNQIDSVFKEVFWKQIYTNYADEFHVIKESGAHNIYSNKLQRTDVGQGYHVWHYESSIREVSNRLLAYIVYLNDVDEGGETEFLYYPRRVKPQAGRVLLFPASFTHSHRGNPPLSNTKYIMTGWVEL